MIESVQQLKNQTQSQKEQNDSDPPTVNAMQNLHKKYNSIWDKFYLIDLQVKGCVHWKLHFDYCYGVTSFPTLSG